MRNYFNLFIGVHRTKARPLVNDSTDVYTATVKSST